MSAGIIFPTDPFNERTPDDAFGDESSAARWANIPISLVDHDSLDYGSDNVRLFKLPESGSEVFYRGWMVTAEEYEAMFIALQENGIDMISTPENYVSAHHLPGWIDIFKDVTPKTVILPADPDHETILRCAEELGAESFIVKDYVKSRKAEWDTACFAPDLQHLPSVVNEFIRLQEEFLVGTVVVREFVELDKSEPEIRVWWVHNVPVLATAHPDDPNTPIYEPSEAFLYGLKELVEELGSPFVTTDLAKKADGEWIVIEVGDGQVSGLPTSITDDQIEKLFTAVLK